MDFTALVEVLLVPVEFITHIVNKIGKFCPPPPYVFRIRNYLNVFNGRWLTDDELYECLIQWLSSIQHNIHFKDTWITLIKPFHAMFLKIHAYHLLAKYYEHEKVKISKSYKSPTQRKMNNRTIQISKHIRGGFGYPKGVMYL